MSYIPYGYTFRGPYYQTGKWLAWTALSCDRESKHRVYVDMYTTVKLLMIDIQVRPVSCIVRF